MKSFTAAVNVSDSGCLFLRPYRLSCRIKTQIYPNTILEFMLECFIFVCIFFLVFCLSSHILCHRKKKEKKLNLKLNKVNCRFCQLIDWFQLEWERGNGDDLEVKRRRFLMQGKSNWLLKISTYRAMKIQWDTRKIMYGFSVINFRTQTIFSYKQLVQYYKCGTAWTS